MPPDLAPIKAPVRLLVAVLAGAACAFAFAPHTWWFLAFFAVGALLRVVLGARFSVAVLCGFLFGVTWFGINVTWIYYVMRMHGGLSPVAAGAVMGLVLIGVGLYNATFAAGVNLLGVRSTRLALFAAPFLWVTLEFIRTHFPIIGFPWNSLGYALVDQLGILQMASVTGIYGLSFAVVLFSGLYFWAWNFRVSQRPRHLFVGLALVGVVLFVLLYTPWVPQAPARYRARLVQPNFPQEPEYPADWFERKAAELDELERLSISPAASPKPEPEPLLIVWPEVPAPFSLQDPRFAWRAERIARQSGRHFLFGAIEWRPGARRNPAPYNSVVLLGPAGERLFVYDKIYLVPFGEYVPMRNLLSFLGKLTAQVGDFEPGTEYRIGQLPDVPGPAEFRQPGPPRKFAVLVCYEAVFPAMARRFVADGAELLVNVSNDAWFGHTAAPAGHLAMARVRAVENRRWLLRATNNGYTVAVDPYGRVVAQMPRDVRGALAAPYDFRSDTTLYVRWGDWFAWLCILVSAGSLLLALKSK